jgi:hypothetical protein
MLFEAGGQPMSAQEPRGLSSSHWAAVIELTLSARAVCRIMVLEVILVRPFRTLQSTAWLSVFIQAQID